jgi:putative hydroxymethylpyrimidine transport system substrate-binding protein
MPRWIAALLLAAALATPPSVAAAADKLTVILDWFVNPDHGPLIVAQEKGFFAEAGLDVQLVAPADPNDPPKLVAAGQADLALDYQPQLQMQVAQGLPLVRIGTLVATPLNCLLTLRDGPVKSIADLKGKRIGYSVAGFEDALLRAMLAKHGLSLSDVQLINVNFSLVPPLLQGQVDAVIGAFRNVELNQVDLQGHPGRAFFVEEEGVPVYDELVFVANKAHLADPRFPRFLQAIERATLYLINHPDESWDLFRKGRSEVDTELNRRAWRDSIARFAHRPAALDRGRYERFAAFLVSMGLVKAMPPVADYAVELP